MFALRVVRVIVDGAQRVRKDRQGFLKGEAKYDSTMPTGLTGRTGQRPHL